MLHFVILAFFVTRFLPRDWVGLKWPVFRPMIKCGQQSLEVFCSGVFLAVIAHLILVEVSGGIWMQILVSATGIAADDRARLLPFMVEKRPTRRPRKKLRRCTTSLTL